jgi:uncharacterized protein
MISKFLLVLSLLLIPSRIIAEMIPIYLDHAVTQEEVAKGLMDRTELPPDHGMTFNYPVPQGLCFWMYKTLIDLSIAFLDENKVILEIHEMKAYPDVQDQNFFLKHCVFSGYKAKYALEMNKNWFTDHRVKVGDQAIWNLTSPQGFIVTKP